MAEEVTSLGDALLADVIRRGAVLDASSREARLQADGERIAPETELALDFNKLNPLEVQALVLKGYAEPAQNSLMKLTTAGIAAIYP